MSDGTQFRVGIFGGTFAPIHNGHIASAKAFMEQMKLDYLYVIPTCLPPHKQIDASDDPKHRLRMCELAFEGVDGVVVSDIEIKRGGKSYTYDTLTELSRPDTRLFLMCGTDMVLSFDKWYRFEDILKLCYPVYVRRENDPIMTQRIVSKITQYYEKYNVMFRRIVTEPIEVSSTLIRKRVGLGEDISALVPASVADYIRENQLYVGDGNNVKQEKAERVSFSEGELMMLAAKIQKLLKIQRFNHTLAVFREVGVLSDLYNMSEHLSELRAAALLHDITKELEVNEHKELLIKHGVPFTDKDLEAKMLLHSKTAELRVKDMFPEFATKRICQAIRYHTTGSADMTLFDAIIYLADYLEETRINDFCIELRKEFYSKDISAMSMEEREKYLWSMVLHSLDSTINNLTSEGKAVDAKTLETRDAIAEKVKQFN